MVVIFLACICRISSICKENLAKQDVVKNSKSVSGFAFLLAGKHLEP